MKLWETESGKALRTFALGSAVTSVAFAMDDRVAVSGSNDDRADPAGRVRLRLWDATTGAELRRLVEPKVTAGPLAERLIPSSTMAALSPDGRQALSNRGNAMLLWDVATGAPLRPFAGYSDYVRYVALSPDGRFAVSNSDHTIHLWDVATGKELRSFGQTWDGAASPVRQPAGCHRHARRLRTHLHGCPAEVAWRSPDASRPVGQRMAPDAGDGDGKQMAASAHLRPERMPTRP
jgi:WD40 repeat protein